MYRMRECYRKIGIGDFAFWRLVKDLSWIWKRMSAAISWAGVGVTYRADRRWPTTKKLLFMATNARAVFRIVGNVRKGSITGSYVLPVIRWKLVARITRHLMCLLTVWKLGILSGSYLGTKNRRWSWRRNNSRGQLNAIRTHYWLGF